MIFYQPSPNLFLREFVRVYRIVHFRFDNLPITPCKAYPPRPEHCLSFYPRDYEQVEFSRSNTKTGRLHAVLFGQLTEVTNRYVGQDFLLLQIVFTPGALFRLTGIPSEEIANSYLDANDFFPGETALVNRQLCDCKTYNEMIGVADSFLLRVIKKKALDAHRLDAACQRLISHAENYSVDWLARASCLSIRQFERKFRERMGVSPKYFARLARFEKAFRMKNMHPAKDWLSIALHCGYYDYQHLVRDYHDFTGQTPADFHLTDMSAPERLFGEVDIF